MDCKIKIIPRLLHFKQPAGTSRGTYSTRKVWYLHFTSSEFPGRVGIGECAPLPAPVSYTHLHDDTIITDSSENKHIRDEAELNNLRVIKEEEFSSAIDFAPCKCMLVSDDEEDVYKRQV